MKRIIIIAITFISISPLIAHPVSSDWKVEYDSLCLLKQIQAAKNCLKHNRLSIIREDGLITYNAFMGVTLALDSKHGKAKPYFDDFISDYKNGKTLSEKLDSDDIAAIWYLAGLTYTETLNFRLVEECYSRCIEILDKMDNGMDLEVWPAVHSGLGQYYGILGNIYDSWGHLSFAKMWYEIKAITCLNYAQTLLNLSNCYPKIDNLTAKLYVDVAIDIINDIIASDDDFIKRNAIELYPIALTDLTYKYQSLGLTKDAERTYNLATSWIRKYKQRPLYQAFADLAMGSTYEDIDDYSRAKSLYKSAYKVLKKEGLGNLSESDIMQTEYATNDPQAYKTALRLTQSTINDITDKFSFLSQNERAGYWDSKRFDIYYAYYILAHDRKPATQTLYNTALFSKGLLLRTTTDITRKAAKNPELAQQLTRLNEYYSLLRKIMEWDQRNTLRDSINSIERRLARQVTDGALQKQLLAQYNWKAVRKALRKTDAAIEFFCIPDTVFIEDGGLTRRGMRYYALIVRKGMSSPEMVPLCTDDSLNWLLKQNKSIKLQRYVSQLYTQEGNAARWHGNLLYDMVWQPLEEHLKGVETVFFSPTGRLSMIAFQAIGRDGKLVSDEMTLRQVSSTSEVTRLNRHHKTQLPHSAYVYGGIDYDTEESTMIAEARGYEHTGERSVCRGDTTRSGMGYLAGTADEAAFVSERLKSKNIEVTTLTGRQANEESIKNIPANAHDMMHIATHGFFLSDDEARRIIVSDSITGSIWPMERAGLVFSGGNHTWLGHIVSDEIDDGILTASEISNIDLRGTQLVVLSACETAQGEPIGEEGVYGLQRAFKLAGAQSLIMSLWKIDDAATSLFMHTFYDGYLAGKPIEMAFKQAVKTLREHPDYKSAYYWGAFILMD